MKGEDGDTITKIAPTVSDYHGESVGTLGDGPIMALNPLLG